VHGGNDCRATLNEREGTIMERLYGVVTIGELWRFMELKGTTVRLDSRSYHIDRLPKIMGILLHLTQGRLGGPGCRGTAGRGI